MIRLDRVDLHIADADVHFVMVRLQDTILNGEESIWMLQIDLLRFT